MIESPTLNRRARFIAADRYRAHRYGSNHPLSIPRVSLTHDLIRAYHAIEDNEFIQSRQATVEELGWFHSPDYIAAMQQAEAEGKVQHEWRQQYNLGNLENPFFPGFFTTPATATGGSIQAAEQVLAGNMAFSPAGGMHHARPGKAYGFCFFNDAVLAVMRLRQAGMRVMYLDIDAHHGDGVEEAFEQDEEVFTCSLHMDTTYAYPFKGGAVTDIGRLENHLNIPLPRQCHDGEYQHIFEQLVAPVFSRWQPDAIVLQAGTDMLSADPLGKLNISTQAFIQVLERIMQLAPKHIDHTPRLAVLGGGGYHPLLLARCWTGVWAALSGRDLPETLPAEAVALLKAVDWDQDEDESWYNNLFQRRIDDAQSLPLRGEIDQLINSVKQRHPLWHEATV